MGDPLLIKLHIEHDGSFGVATYLSNCWIETKAPAGMCEVMPMNYDVFLSHSHVDKVWTRELCDRLAKADYNGRNLRAWLDVHVLDPGDLSSARELESAMDRSRRIALVLTPESLASDWVQHEIGYFLKSRPADDMALIRRRPCDVPASGDWVGPPQQAILLGKKQNLWPQNCLRLTI